MPLPSGHPWENEAPIKDNEGYFSYLVIGSSNHAVGAQTGTLLGKYNINRNFIWKHNNTVEGFSDPPNDQIVTTYDRLDETGTQNYTSFLSERLREFTNKRVCAVTAGQSATGISNQLTGYNSPTTLTQTGDMLTAAIATIGGLQFACVGVSDGDMRFNPTAQQIEDLIDDYIDNLRTEANDPNLPIALVCPGLTPPTPAVADLYSTWGLHNTTLKAFVKTGVYIVDTDSLDVATYREVDEVHRNAAGNKACADLIITALESNGVI